MKKIYRKLKLFEPKLRLFRKKKVANIKFVLVLEQNWHYCVKPYILL